MEVMTEWLDVWIEEGVAGIYLDNNMLMPFVTGDPKDQPSIHTWHRSLPCGFQIFYKGYCLHTSSRCEQHCTEHYGYNCWHAHGKKIVIKSENMGQFTLISKEWE